MIEIQAPNYIPNDARSVFLAGSIEMGAAPLWQSRVVDMLKETDWMILNPRRDDWDSSWVQSIDNPQFNEQVTWELDGLERASKVVIFFAPGTQSPISLLELGLLASTTSEKLIVVCPDGFWRKGNVDIVCRRYGAELVDTIEEAVRRLKEVQ